mmetsp:Transcript_11170/g.19148  ORF Transcript_11170/g.19148 Transcript_11170/m.19148 type:complete len:81 (+) Transcript_11170:1-243(+)
MHTSKQASWEAYALDQGRRKAKPEHKFGQQTPNNRAVVLSAAEELVKSDGSGLRIRRAAPRTSAVGIKKIHQEPQPIFKI